MEEQGEVLPKKDSLFVVRPAVSLEDLRWIACASDTVSLDLLENFAEMHFVANHTRFFFIGELEGERISCVCIVKLSETRSYLSTYFVMPPYHGKGYGLGTWKYAWERNGLHEAVAAKNVNISMYCVPNMEYCYEKFGFRRVWSLTNYTTSLGQLKSNLATVEPAGGMRIIPGTTANVEKVAEYVHSTTGVLNAAFISAAIVFASASFVALDEESAVIGCVAAFKWSPFDKYCGFRIGLLMADSHEIAAILMKRLADAVVQLDGVRQSDRMVSCVPRCVEDTIQFVENTLGMSVSPKKSMSVAMHTQAPQAEVLNSMHKVLAVWFLEMGC